MGQYKVPGKKTVNENLYKPKAKALEKLSAVFIHELDPVFPPNASLLTPLEITQTDSLDKIIST